MEPLCHSALLTDLYELTMAAAFFENGLQARASFELFIRKLPPTRSYLVAAGLEQALDYLEQLHFPAEEVEFLRRHPAFEHVGKEFFEYLRELRFTGDVWAMAEGTLAFAEEPLLRVTAPIIEAQIVETFLLSALTFPTMIASKAARVAEAAQGRDVVEFGTRRAHGPEAGTLAARAAYIGGCAGTSNVEAGLRFGIPTSGTMAHSFVMAHDEEVEAFRAFERVFPENSILLLDTYDTLGAVDEIIRAGLRPAGVRLDSGDLVRLSKEVRRKLDAGGLRATRIFASGDLDESAITEVLAKGAPVDAFGVGTALATSSDAPALGGVYKLVEVSGEEGWRPRAKFSEEKVTYPGCKQVWRFHDERGQMQHDLIARCDESYPRAEALLECVMRKGRRVGAAPPLAQVRARARRNLARLPSECRQLHNAASYPVRTSGKLDALLEEIRNRMAPSESK
jgi:nicotinate phosphoribosyltransferase